MKQEMAGFVDAMASSGSYTNNLHLANHNNTPSNKQSKIIEHHVIYLGWRLSEIINMGPI